MYQILVLKKPLQNFKTQPRSNPPPPPPPPGEGLACRTGGLEEQRAEVSVFALVVALRDCVSHFTLYSANLPILQANQDLFQDLISKIFILAFKDFTISLQSKIQDSKIKGILDI